MLRFLYRLGRQALIFIAILFLMMAVCSCIYDIQACGGIGRCPDGVDDLGKGLVMAACMMVCFGVLVGLFAVWHFIAWLRRV